MSCVIVAGGQLDEPLLQRMIQTADVVIAADRGLEALQRLGIRPHYIIGDFDSASHETVASLEDYETMPDVEVIRLCPEKDDTDTEAALQLAFSKSDGDITILGGTGSRLDHVLGNIAVLGQGLERGRSVCLVDAHNRIRMIDRELILDKHTQYGTYVSVFPYGERACGVTMDGFYYPLSVATLEGYNSLGVSNEITAEQGVIRVKQGALIVIESRD